MKKLVFLAATLFVSTLLNAQFSIGHSTVTFEDPDRGGRAILTEIYYPANSSGDDVAAAEGEYPVIVFGHGFVMVWSAYANIWEHLVPRGYIMAFPRTEGNIFPNHEAFGQDLAFLVGAMQDLGNNNASPLFGHVNSESAIMGHSMGGGCSFLAGAAVEVNTIIGLAPAETNTSAIGAAASVNEPVLVLSGDADGVTPPAEHHIPIYEASAADCKHFISIEEGSHCYFANSNFNCDFGEFFPGSLSRSEQHQIQFNLLDPWLDYHLKSECDDYTAFLDYTESDNRVSREGICDYVPNDCLVADCPADLNGDNQVNSADLVTLLSEMGCSSNCLYDLNNDAVVGTADLTVFLAAFGTVCG